MSRSKDFLINKGVSIKQAMHQMKEFGEKVLFVVNEQNKLCGALSDGDIRRWILSGGSLDKKVSMVCNVSPKFVFEDYGIKDIKRLMIDLKIECIPVVNSAKEIKEVLTWDGVFGGKVSKHKEKLNIQTIIMAGGKGIRLDPFTRILPKPLMPIGNKPIIEIIMDKFNDYGINEFFITLNHKSKMIKSYFEDTNNKYRINYVEEKKPLGTAGGIRLLKDDLVGSFIVSNCDIIIEADYVEIVKFHKENNYDITLVVSLKHYVIPYGICEIEKGGELNHMKEKPEYDLLVNTGMYIVKKRIIDLIPKGKSFNFTDLIIKAKKLSGYKVGVFPIDEKSWIDIGHWDEYRKVINKLRID